MFRVLATIAAAFLLAACDDPRAPKVDDEEPAFEVNEDELREEGREAGRAIGEGAEDLGDAAERTGERLAPEGERK